MGRRTVTTSILIAVSLLAAILIDVLLPPDYPIPLIYAVPILIAVYRAPPRAAGAVAALAIMANILSDYFQQIPFSIWSLYTLIFLPVAVALVFLAYRLSEQKKENTRLYEQSEVQRARWEAMVESMIDPVTVSDAEGHAIYMNPIYSQYIGRHIKPGISLEEHPTYYQLYRSDGTIFEPQDLPLQKAALSGKEVRNVEVVHRTAENGEFAAIWNASPIRDSRGQVVGAVAVGRDITESRKAEEALRESEERYRQLVELSPDVIFIQSEGRIVFINPAGVKLFGADSPEQLIGKPVLELMHPDYRQIVQERIRQLREEKTGVPLLEEKYLRLDGTSFDVEVKATPFVYQNKPAAQVIAREIGDRKRAEEALRQAKDYAEKIVQTANVMVVGLDATGHIRLFNRAAEEITGYTKDELEGRSWFEVLVPRDRYPQVWEVFATFMAEGTLPRVFENPILTKSGEERFISWRNGVLEEEGHPSGTISFGIDITERKKAEEERERLLRRVKELAAASQRRAAELQAILDHMVDAVLVGDRDGRLTLVNQPALELLGLSKVGDLKQGISQIARLIQLRHPDGRSLAPDEMALARALKGEVVLNYDQVAVNLHTGRDLDLRVNAAPIKDDRGEIVGAVAVVRDITELTELDRLKDQFIDVAAHELKTPLTVMKGSAQYLLQSTENPQAAQRRLLESMNRNADRINRIVGDLLDISQLQHGELHLDVERFDLCELVEEVMDRMALTAKRHRLFLGTAEHLVVSADRDRLGQVLTNLIDNAIRYSPKGGEIELSTQAKDNEAVVSVKDRGVGIPKNKQGRIFQRFYRAHMGTPYDYGGMGIGLYISQEIVSRHGGRIWFESQEGKGSTFSFALPLQAKTQEATGPD